METTICRLCLETVSNYICVDCLFSNIQNWVSSKNLPELNQKILEKQSEIKKLIYQEGNGAVCVVCKKQIEEVACPCCYLYEMFSVIKSHDPDLAYEFEKYFNFDFNFHHGFSQLDLLQSLNKRILSSRNFTPVLIVDKQKTVDINICESCGQSSDNLKELNGQWLCESCMDMLSF